MWTFNRMIAAALLSVFMLLPASGTLAATSKDVNKQMRNAQKLYFNGKIQEADDALKKAEEMAAEIMVAPDAAEKSKVQRLDGRLKKLRKDIDRKLGKTDDAMSNKAVGKVPAAKTNAISVGSGELPSHVISDLKVVERYLANVQQNLDSGDIRNARRSLGSAQDKLQMTAEHKKRYITSEHPEYKALQARIDELDTAVSAAESVQDQQKAAADKAAAAIKAESDKWVAKLKPYVTGLGQPGYDPDRYFIGSYTADQQDMAKRAVIFGKVSADMEAYRAAGLGDKASDELKLIIRDIDYKLETFEESTKSMADLKVKEAGRQIDYIITWLNEEAKKIGSKDMPLIMNRMTFESARGELDAAASLLGKEDERVKALEAKYNEALSLDAKLARIRIGQTRMIPDKFGGPELSVLKKKAEEVLADAKSSAKILRTTVISSDWKEESVIEWTDTTRSVLRHRNTRSVSAQVAGKLGNETTLYTIFIAKDRRTDGSWSPLRGHIMFEDPILEENVGK